jgi:restriction system protein
MANRYTREVRHEGLGKYRVISGTDSYIVAAKAEALMYEWEQKYQLIVAVRKDKQWALEQKQMFLQNKEKKKDEFEQKLHYAEERTNAAQEEIALIRNILKTGLESPGEINWDKLKIQAPFTNPEPKPPRYINYPQEPKLTDDLYQPGLNIRGPNSAQATYLALPNAPDRAHPKYQPDIKLIDKIIKSKMEEKLLEAEAIYNFDCKAWEEKVEQINLENQSRANELFKKDYDEWVQNVDYVRKTNEEAYKSNVEEVESWNRASAEYNSKVEANIAATDDLRARYESHQASGIEDYGALLLALSHYSEGFQQDCDIEYNPATKILILASSTFLVGKRAGMVFSGGEYDTGKDVSADIGAG